MLEKSRLFIDKARLLIKWALPFTCLLCHQKSDREQDLCQACLQSLPIITHNCGRCAQRLPIASWLCGACLKNPPPYQSATTLYIYEEPLVSLILGLKFQGQLANARVLGELLAAAMLKQSAFKPDLLLPVPLHHSRLKERGFNQAVELARPAAKALALPLECKAVQRIKSTATQMSLSAKERRLNLKGAFQVDKSLSGKKIWVIDDVMTTGSTVRELGRALLAAGATEVRIWCLARA